MTSPEHVVVEVDIKSNAYKQKIQQEFIQVFKDFSDVVNDNVLIIGEKYLHKYEKKHNKIEAERLEFSKKGGGDCEKKPEKKKVIFQDPPWLQHEEYRYMIKKIEDTQKKLNMYLNVLDYFYLDHKKWYDRISTLIIFISSGMSFFEAISMSFEFGRYSKIGTVFISTSVAALTSFLKFKNYKEKAEEVVRIKEKVFASQSKIFLFEKDLKSKLYLYNQNEPPE